MGNPAFGDISNLKPKAHENWHINSNFAELITFKALNGFS